MSITSAKRQGLEVRDDLELESRLRRIEVELDRRVRTNDASTTLSRATVTVPQVKGLSTDAAIIGGLSVKWTPVTISNLRRYEVQFATDVGFTTSVQEFITVTPNFTFTTASTSQSVYYCRVRAVNSAGVKGEYSVVLNVNTGQISGGNLADDSVTDDQLASASVTFDKLDDSSVGSLLALSGYVNGLQMSVNSVDPLRDIDISSGIARDSTNIASMTLSSAITKQLDAVWAAGTGAGGRASSISLAANTVYFMFVVGSEIGTAVDAGFDTSPLAANLLSDLTSILINSSNTPTFRRIGAVLTDSSSNIRGFTQFGDFFQLNTPVQVIDASNPGTSEVTHTLAPGLSSAVAHPLGIECIAHLTIDWARFEGGFPANVRYGPVEASLSAPTTTNTDGTARASAKVITLSPSVKLNAAGQMKTRSTYSDSDLNVKISVHGWTDLRGKDGKP